MPNISMDVPQKHDSTPPPITLNWPLIAAFIVFIAVGAGLVFFLAATRTIPVLPTPASAQASRTDTLFYILLGVGAIVFFLVQGLLLYSVIRFRAKPNDMTDGPNIHGNPTLEIVWTIIPAVVVVLLSGLSVVVWTENVAPKENENLIAGQVVDVQVVAKRFLWAFFYDTGINDVNGNPIILDSIDLHTYEGQDVWLQMNAEDVIHSLWVPEMRIKQDVMPGKTTELRFTPINTGEGYKYAYEFNDEAPLGAVVEIPAAQAREATIANRFNAYQVVCTELCGSGHGGMRAKVIVHESEDSFLAWYNAQVESRKNPPDDPVLLGQQILSGITYQCRSCHVLSSLGWIGATGPNLDGIADRAASRAAEAGDGDVNGAEYIMHSIRKSQDYITPGSWSVNMPAFQEADPTLAVSYMPDDHLVGIVAYLCTQTASGTPSESTCGIEFGEDGLPTDVDATVELLRGLATKYDSNPDNDQ